MTRLISGVYSMGMHSRAHYTRSKSDKSVNWAYVPKNTPRCRTTPINKWQHAYEMQHGMGPVSDPLMEMLK